jgi:hypothetical protein
MFTLLLLLSCQNRHQDLSGNWYIINFSSRPIKCIPAIDGSHIMNPQEVLNISKDCKIFKEKKDAIILDCTQEKKIEGFLFFGRTMDECEKLYPGIKREKSADRLI